jgi:hypothetical protein
MTTDREALLELIRKQPPMSSEQFWQQVEKARVLSRPTWSPQSLGRKNQSTNRSRFRPESSEARRLGALRPVPVLSGMQSGLS